MCNITVLPPKKNIPMKLLQNAVWNNPHGFGLIIDHGEKKKKDRLEVIRRFHESGTDPEEIDDLLRSNDEFNRFLHVRWQTEGARNLDNCHPFKIYDDGKNQAYFMHNGTLYDWKPKSQSDTRCDSKIFAEEFLSEFLEDRKGDYSSDWSKKIIHKFWGSSTNRGLIVSTNQLPVFINLSDWKDIQTTDEEGKELKFRSSNDEYFTTLKRGFEYDRLEAEKKRLEEERRNKAQSELPLVAGQDGSKPSWPIIKLNSLNFKPNKDLSEELTHIFNDSNLWEEDGLASLENVTPLEFETACVKKPSEMASLLVYLTSEFARVVLEKNTAEEKHTSATKIIAQKVQEIEKLKNAFAVIDGTFIKLESENVIISGDDSLTEAHVG